jgi:hypothetical protein
VTSGKSKLCDCGIVLRTVSAVLGVESGPLVGSQLFDLGLNGIFWDPVTEPVLNEVIEAWRASIWA